MKVLYITNYDTMYGANKSLFTMMSLLQEKYNVEPYLLVPGRNGGVIGGLCTKRNISLFTYDFRISAIDEKTKYKPIRKFTRRCMRYVDFYRVYKCISTQNVKFDLVHSNSSIFDIGYFLSKKWKVPHVWHIREFARKDYALEPVLDSKSICRKYQNSSAVISISKSIYAYVKHLDINIPLKLIYNGVDIPDRYDKHYFENDVINFCIVGSLNPRKNVLDVIKACVELQRQNILNYRLYIVGGKEGNDYEVLNNYIKEHSEISEHIFFTGYCDDVFVLLKKMDVGIMASEAEAFGRVTVEYMASYMAVIGTNTGGTPEILNCEEDLYPPHDIFKLTELMKKYIGSPCNLEEKGRQNRLRAEFFSAEKNAEEVYKLYESINCLKRI